ncbi:MAG: KEOPS complex N(6)-L-threonylcarbamoyladenine synthase Kae1, partial [Candidatus Bathyarchaeota archaeon]
KAEKLICLGIESTAHTFGVSLVSSNGEIIVDINSKYEPSPKKGIHPREAAQHHCQVAPEILKQALKESRISVKKVDAIAFSAGPGLGPALRTGATVARALSIMLDRPLIPIHHAIGHIEIASLTTGAVDPLVVLVSGGHTTITAYGDGYWRVFGETEDITLGNLLDTFAREAGLQSPGGPAVEKLALKGKRYVGLPYVVKGNDVSYSGILTSAIKMLDGRVMLEDLCYSIQEVSFAMLAEAAERALAHTEKSEVLLTGGVAANDRLKQMIRVIAEEHNAKFFVVPKAYSGDCGAQIALTGILAYQSGVHIEVEKSLVRPRWRLDQVKIPWRSSGV